MLKLALSFKRVSWCPNILSKPLALLSYLLPTILFILPATAAGARLGVVRSDENTKQWQEIVKRLKATGVDYCIVNESDWQDSTAFGDAQVILLPNVENIELPQATALEQWMGRGGRLIVTGPTGNLALPEVRAQLRSLFGAYWAFSNSFPASLETVGGLVPQQEGTNATIIGGVLLPTKADSQTEAVWISEERLPAVVASDRATYLGWRWGMGGVASPAFDIAWMEAVLNRYGIGRYNDRATLVKQSQATDCNAEDPLAPTRQQAPILPQEQSRSLPTPQVRSVRQSSAPSSITSPEQFVAPSTNLNNLGEEFSPARVSAMDREIESLIARFESTLLAAKANNSNITASTQELVEQSLKSGAYASADTTAVPQSSSAKSLSHPAITEARARLEKFHQFVEQGDYAQAKQQWIEARRTLWDNYPTDRQFANSEMRAMWLDRGTIVKARSEADLAKVFDRMAQAGINTVFFETVNASYTIYPSRIAPEQNPLTKGWDPLKAAVKLAHERGMELHAWVWTFAAVNQRHNLLLNQPRNYLGPVLSRHPKWAMTDKKGGVFDFTAQYQKAFLDPANPEVQRYLQALVEEIATQYDVDGIQFDYIRYPFQDPQRDRIFGYSDISRSQFKQQTGVDPVKISSSHPLWHQWTAYRVRQVDNFVATTSAKLKQKRPDLLVSVAVFPLPKQERLMRLQQNWEEWGKRGWVDATVLMTYALDTINLEETTKILQDPASAGSSLLIPGLRLLSVPDAVTFDQLQYLRNIPSSGYALFAAENFTPDLQAIFSRTQGSTTTAKSAPLPYRQPFQSIVDRYGALQREWGYLLTQNVISMDEIAMKEWGQEADRLSVAFNRLAEQPSPENLRTAQTTLTNFRSRFDRWMSLQQEKQPYQVQTWANRLTMLDNLLVYGDRF